ncbi:hypothetical protein [Nguyenibacter sp. L1]|uniref:hypothetical protein n=1 Tax=Nguyenibacter sp. L1 TaxID=3049350 RepID=UPI002B48F507|nr:hypothetical protein [Nguyenibacter sp. L1]WRH89228.1 hypothetical protein QN315_06365 [Nguyenibacter sp. L1]
MADADVVAWLSNIDATMLCLSAVTIVKNAFGVLRIERRGLDQGGSAAGWISAFCLNSRIESCRSIRP